MPELFTIKPLVWERAPSRRFARTFHTSSPLPGIRYSVGCNKNEQWWCQSGLFDPILCGSPEEGKQLAETHWREYISQALERVPTEPATDSLVKIIAAEVLEMASDKFSNHGCNDYTLSDTPLNREFVSAMNKWSGLTGEDAEPHVSSDGKIYTQDWEVMSYCAHLLKAEAEDSTP